MGVTPLAIAYWSTILNYGWPKANNQLATFTPLSSCDLSARAKAEPCTSILACNAWNFFSLFPKIIPQNDSPDPSRNLGTVP